MNQLSMDCPNTNWAVLEKVIAAREENDEPKYAEIGSCSLHIIFHLLMLVSMQVIGKLMKSWKQCEKFFLTLLLERTYLKSSIPEKLPQRFCGTQWVENEDAAEKAILVWPDIVALIVALLIFCPSNRAKNNKSFEKLAQLVNDKW